MLALTLLPVPGSVGELFPKWFDKVVHFGLFSTLAALIYWDRTATGRPSRMGALLPTVVLAGLIELIQGPLPRRSGDVWDFVLGVVGAIVGMLVAAWLVPRYAPCVETPARPTPASLRTPP